MSKPANGITPACTTETSSPDTNPARRQATAEFPRVQTLPPSSIVTIRVPGPKCATRAVASSIRDFTESAS